MLDNFNRLLRPLSVRISNLIGRGVVKSADDAQQVQELQVELLTDEVRDEVERFQEYGFTSVPRDGAEVVIAFVGGRRDQGFALGVEDRRYRIKNLSKGEVAVYNDTGAKIVMKANGDVEVTPKAGQKVRLSGDTVVAGDLQVTGTANVTDCVAGTVSLKTHKHGAGTLVSPSSGGSVTGASDGPV